MQSAHGARDGVVGGVKVEGSSVTSDAYWAPDLAHMDAMRQRKPWSSDPRYFRRVCMSALAALKMFVHATRGSPDRTAGRHEWYEVMGLMLGHYKDDTLIVLDSFGLPVVASEVECCMNDNSLVYMAEYINYYRRVGKPDRGCIGWYHTHPGYACFLSGIDVSTQQQSQRMHDPWLAIVIDPISTLSSGKLDVKAFRVLPDDDRTVRISAVGERGAAAATAAAATGAAATASSFDRVSSQLVRDYGVYAHRYYELPITLVRSTQDAAQLDTLMRQYWPLTLTTTPLLVNRAYHTTQMAYITQLLPPRRRGARNARDGAATTCRNDDGDDTQTRQSRSSAAARQALGAVALYDDRVGAYDPPWRRVAAHAADAESADALAMAASTAAMATKGKHNMLTATTAEKKAHAAQLSAALAKDALLDSMLLSIKTRVFRALPST